MSYNFIKRRSDISKWNNDSWKYLSSDDKVLYMWLWDNASDAGIVISDIPDRMLNLVHKIDTDIYYINGFIQCHFSILCREWRSHLAVIKELERFNLVELPEIKRLIVDKYKKIGSVERGVRDEYLKNIQKACVEVSLADWKVFKNMYPNVDLKSISEWLVLDCKKMEKNKVWQYMCELAERKLTENDKIATENK